MISAIPLAVFGLVNLANGLHIRSSELAQEPWVSQSAPSRAIGKLPALGWNTWNAYRCSTYPISQIWIIFDSKSFGPDINESNVLAAADQFISLGLKDAGYTYVNIDVRLNSTPGFTQ